MRVFLLCGVPPNCDKNGYIAVFDGYITKGGGYMNQSSGYKRQTDGYRIKNKKIYVIHLQ